MSDLRQGYKPIQTPKPLYFGTAVHAGLETYYHPVTWGWLQDDRRPLVHAASLQAFLDSLADTKKRYLKMTGREALDPDQKEEYEAERELGKGMLRNYFEWAPTVDHFTPIAVEVKFRVPIMHEGVQIAWYQGRVDLLVQDDAGFYWIFDHKTTSRWQDTSEFLELDEQMGSYIWALRSELKLNIIGATYNELYKAFPEPPKENLTCRQGRWFSVNKQQATSYEVYKATVMEQDPKAYAEGLYNDFLQYLKAEGPKYFKRTTVHRSVSEMRDQGNRIVLETLDMLGNPRIYPNPTRFRCDHCPMRGPCLLRRSGGDEQWMLDEYFVREHRT